MKIRWRDGFYWSHFLKDIGWQWFRCYRIGKVYSIWFGLNNLEIWKGKKS